MTTATGPGGRDRTFSWRNHYTAIVCTVLIGILLLVLALPSPWGLGAFELNQPPVSIVSFEFNQSLINPGGPAVILSVENTGSSSIVNLSASLQLQYPYVIDFPSVSAASPLEPRQSASANGIIVGPYSPYCGSVYNWTISGTFSSGSIFEIHTTAPFHCPPPNISQEPTLVAERSL